MQVSSTEIPSERNSLALTRLSRGTISEKLEAGACYGGWSVVRARVQLAMALPSLSATPRGTGYYGAADASQKLWEERKPTKAKWKCGAFQSAWGWKLGTVCCALQNPCTPLCTCGIENGAAMETETGFYCRQKNPTASYRWAGQRGLTNFRFTFTSLGKQPIVLEESLQYTLNSWTKIERF